MTAPRPKERRLLWSVGFSATALSAQRRKPICEPSPSVAALLQSRVVQLATKLKRGHLSAAWVDSVLIGFAHSHPETLAPLAYSEGQRPRAVSTMVSLKIASCKTISGSLFDTTSRNESPIRP